jgi:hypothetical protein
MSSGMIGLPTYKNVILSGVLSTEGRKNGVEGSHKTAKDPSTPQDSAASPTMLLCVLLRSG